MHVLGWIFTRHLVRLLFCLHFSHSKVKCIKAQCSPWSLFLPTWIWFSTSSAHEVDLSFWVVVGFCWWLNHVIPDLHNSELTCPLLPASQPTVVQSVFICGRNSLRTSMPSMGTCSGHWKISSKWRLYNIRLGLMLASYAALPNTEEILQVFPM